MIEMIDSIISPETTEQPIPAEVMNAEAVLGYIAGNSWPTYHPYVAARPDLAAKGRIISTTLTCVATARCYDIEAHGGQNRNIGIFMQHADRTHGLPILYTFASDGAAMLAAAKSFGYTQSMDGTGGDFFYLSAHTGRGRHVCAPDVCGFPRSNGTQYEFDQAFDRSTVPEYMFPSLKPPPPPNPYAMFPTDLPADLPNHGNERLTVEQVDGALEHPVKYHDYLKGQLRPELKTFRDRIWRVSHFKPPDFVIPRDKPDWSDDRGVRWQALNRRMVVIDALPSNRLS